MKNITKKQALEACLKIWSTLTKTGDSDKESVRIALDYIHECPCCHYVVNLIKKSSHKRNCKRKILFSDIEAIKYSDMACSNEIGYPKKVGCPLASLWPNGCLDDSSPFAIWNNTKKISTRKIQAKKIADKCRELLEKYEKSNNAKETAK